MNPELKKIIYCMGFLTTKVAQICEYNWDAGFAVSELKEAYAKIQEELKSVDFKSMTLDELFLARFGNWDENVILCPLYLKDTLKPKAADNDTRFGCIAYGWSVEDGKVNWGSDTGIF